VGFRIAERPSGLAGGGEARPGVMEGVADGIPLRGGQAPSCSLETICHHFNRPSRKGAVPLVVAR
jgi:hypothetical protein